MDQAARELAVGALLDITVQEFYDFITTYEEEPPEDVQQPLANLYEYLNAHEGQLYIQQVALLADETLAWIVTNVHHKNTGN
jgi:hypothetical protein